MNNNPTTIMNCVQKVEYYLKQISTRNEELNIFLEILEEKALKRAKELDDKKQSGEKLGKLFGVVVALKSNIFVEDVVCACASKTLENVKAIYNSDVAHYMLQEDAIIIGMVNNDEFAQGSTGEHSYFNKTLNPQNTTIVPGGTSSGSAAAVSSDMCDIALGTDTGGSCRTPASHCGVYGLKPSYGRVSRYGVVDSAMSFDQVGILSKTLEDAIIMLEVIGKYSENDAVSLQVEDFSYTQNEVKRIGILKGCEELISDNEIKEVYHQTIEEFKSCGIEIVECEIKHMALGVAAYYPIVYTEVFSGTRKFDSVKFGQKIDDVALDELKLRMQGGKLITQAEFEGAYYKKALTIKHLIAQDIKEVFKRVDCILLPTTPKLPHSFDEVLDSQEEYAYDVFTVLANLAGVCSGVIPRAVVETSKGNIPIGMQIMADTLQENTIFNAMKLLEKKEN